MTTAQAKHSAPPRIKRVTRKLHVVTDEEVTTTKTTLRSATAGLLDNLAAGLERAADRHWLALAFESEAERKERQTASGAAALLRAAQRLLAD